MAERSDGLALNDAAIQYGLAAQMAFANDHFFGDLAAHNLLR